MRDPRAAETTDIRDDALITVGSGRGASACRDQAENSVSTAAIAAAPLAALDLPLRVIVWEDEYQTKVSYPSPGGVARRYGLDSDVAAALESIHAVTRAVIDR
jgi:hypothetical protein